MKFLELDADGNPIGDGNPPVGSSTPTPFLRQVDGHFFCSDKGRNRIIYVRQNDPNDPTQVSLSRYPMGDPRFDLRLQDLAVVIEDGTSVGLPAGFQAIQWPK